MKILAKHSFLALLITQFLGALNDNLFRTSLTTLIAFKIITTTDSADILIYVSLGLFILPFFIFSALAGQIADKFPKNKLIVILKGIEIIISFLALFAFLFHDIPCLIFLIFLSGTQSAFFGPVKYSIVPDLVNHNKLLKANASVESSTFVAILLGGIMGSAILKVSNFEIIVPILLLLSSFIGCITSLSIKNIAPKDSGQKLNFNFITSTVDLCRYINEKRSLILSIMGISWLWFTGSIFFAAMPVIFSKVLHLTTDYYTWFLVVFTCGVSFGTFTCSYLLKDKISSKYVPITLLLSSFVLIDFSNTLGDLTIKVNGPFISRLFIDLFLVSFLAGIYSVPLYAIIQYKSSEKRRARNMAVNNVFNALFMLASTIYLFTLDELFSVSFSKIFLILAFLNFAVTFLATVFMPGFFIKILMKRILKFFFRVEVIGIENYLKAGKNTLIIANHTSYLDPPLINVFLPDNLIFAINTQQAQKWWIRPILKLVNTLSIDPSNPLALKTMIGELKNDKRVVIFPEGRITTTGSLMKVYEGPAMVADKSRANILPIKISGAEFSYFSKMKNILKLRLFPKITIEILPHTKISIDKNQSLRAKRHQAGMHLYDIMSEMYFKTYKYANNLSEALICSAKKYGGDIEVITDINNNHLTYKKLIIASDIFAKKINCTANNIGIMLPNASVTPIIFFAVQALSKTVVMINYTAGKYNITSACYTASLKTVITSRNFIEKANLFEVVAELKKRKIKLIYVEDIKKSISIIDKFVCFIKYSFSTFNRKTDIIDSEINKPAVILFTSGSEGHPKAVVLSHKNIQANIAQSLTRIDLNTHDLVFNALPIFHCYGLTGATLLPLLSGVKTFLYPTPLHYRVIPEIIYDIGATILFGTNTFLSSYAKFAHPYDFYKIKYVIAGAEKLKDETQKLWNEKFGIRILEGYGVTETTPVISINTPMYYKPKTAGRILPGISYKIKKLKDITEGGELYISGPNVMLGYIFHDKPKTIVKPKSGYHSTGDIAQIDQEGFVTILGRSKRFAKIGGEMVPLASVEERISNLWPLDLHAIVSQITETKGERLVLITNYKQARIEEIQKYFKELGLPTFYLPKEVIIVDKIPILGSGKINYPELSELLK